MSAEQLSLFRVDPYTHLFPYWREQLTQWPKEALYYRHHRNCTGWSMALGGYDFARMLFRHGQLSREQLRRYWRFNRRLWRMEGRK